MKKENNINKLFKVLIIISLLINYFNLSLAPNEIKNIFKIWRTETIKKFKRNNNFSKEPEIKIFIMTHRDFKNYRVNPAYNIVADDKSQLRENYSLNLIYANKGKLYNMKRSYSEMSKLYYIYQLYKDGNYSSKYIGLNHYRRYFNFTDNIPNLDEIFKNYDIILNSPYFFEVGMKNQFCSCAICEKYDEVLKIIKDIKPKYYETAMKTINEKIFYGNNLFIMKKKDFLKYCKFIYDVLFEFDRRNNFYCDDDVLNYTTNFFNDTQMQLYQSRLQGFLAERLSNIFFYQNFKKIKTFDSGDYKRR